jgi:hypothetical protein
MTLKVIQGAKLSAVVDEAGANVADFYGEDHARNAAAFVAALGAKPKARTKAVAPDYRTAVEKWQAGEAVKRTKRTGKGTARTVIVRFVDGVETRVSTYLDGQAGLNEAGAFARSIRQTPLRTEKVKIDWLIKRTVDGVTVDQGGEWVKDGQGVWRLVSTVSIPDLASVEYEASEQREAA